MKTCPWCEGRKVVGRLAHGEEPDSVTVLGRQLPVIGTMLEVGCRVCNATGRVPDDFSFERRLAELRRKRGT